MLLSKFDLDQKMSIAEMKAVKAGAACCSDGVRNTSSTSNDYMTSTSDSDGD